MRTLLASCLSLLLLAACTSDDGFSPEKACAAHEAEEDRTLCLRAHELAQDAIIVDGHIDVPYRMTQNAEDITQATEGGDFDYPRAQQGGLDAPFMSIYIPAARQNIPGSARSLADSLIDMVEGFAERAPDKFAVAYSVADVREQHEQDLVSLPMGMENGAPIESLADVQHFYDRGIRYVTLTHGRINQLSDSSYDTTRTHNGISALGEAVVREMNDLGIMVDISHLSDSAFYDVLRVTEAPVIASHSSLRHFTPGFERNMDDDMLRALAENGGVIMINFGSSFLRTAYQAEGGAISRRIRGYITQQGWDRDSPEALAYFREQRRANPVGTIDDVVEHIDRVVELVGVDYVGLGSDYDGVFALPAELQDISMYPNLVFELLKKGYSEADIRKILGENALRVWSQVEDIAAAS